MTWLWIPASNQWFCRKRVNKVRLPHRSGSRVWNRVGSDGVSSSSRTVVHPVTSTNPSQQRKAAMMAPAVVWLKAKLNRSRNRKHLLKQWVGFLDKTWNFATTAALYFQGTKRKQTIATPKMKTKSLTSRPLATPSPSVSNKTVSRLASFAANEVRPKRMFARYTFSGVHQLLSWL